MGIKTAYDSNCFKIAFSVSFIAHCFLLYALIFGIHIWGEDEKKPAIIYSVTMESGSLLGGINQVPTGKQETPIAPPKKTSAPQPKGADEKNTVVEKTVEKKSEPVKVQPKVEDAEVSLAEKKPTPKPTPKVEAKKQPTPKPTVAPKATPKVVATPVPKATPVQKPVVNNRNNNSAGSSNGRNNVSNSADIDRGYQQAMQRYLGASTNAGGQGFGGDGRGGRGMGGGVYRPPEWFRYKELLEVHVKRGWKWHQPNARLRAAVSFRISVSGVVSDLRISESSGNAMYDQSILRAISKASPVPIPPAQFYEDFKFVEIEFTPDA